MADWEGLPRITAMLRQKETPYGAVYDASRLLAERTTALSLRRRAKAIRDSGGKGKQKRGAPPPTTTISSGFGGSSGACSSSTTSTRGVNENVSSLVSKFSQLGAQKEFQTFLSAVRKAIRADFSLEELQGEAEA